jgi:hypothetical protein
MSRDVVCAKWDASARPEEHHGALQTDCVVTAIINDYLGDELRVLAQSVRNLDG